MSPRLHYFQVSTPPLMHGACVGPGLHQCMQRCEMLLFVTTEDGKHPYFQGLFFNHFLSTLVYVEVVYVCLQIETIVGFLHLRFFCLHLLLFFFASVLIPQSLLTVCYWSGSWSWNWSMCSVTCLRYPTWAISLNNVFINWLIITVKLISRIYICVLPTIDL